MASGLSYGEDTPSKSGFYISKCAAFVAVLVVVLLLVAEGLLVGLVGRPTCDTKAPEPTTSASPAKTTTNKDVAETTDPKTSFTTPDMSAIWYNNRLPDSLIPISYEVKLRPVLEKDSATGLYIFYGSSSVTYTCNKATPYVMMHSNDLNYTQPLTKAFSIYDNTDKVDVSITDVMFYFVNQYVVITTDSPCVEGHNYTMHAPEFQGELGEDLSGLYRSEYDNKDGQHRVIATSQMETTGARDAFPCFDEPSFKATFLITLYHRTDDDYFAVSNMPPETYKAETIDGDQWNSTTFEVTPIMSTYLLALVVCDFPYDEAFAANGTIQTRIYARDVPVNNNEVLYAADMSPTILDVFASHFNVPYPLPKSDQMAVSDFGAGAMENWGLVIYREVYLLYDNSTSSISNKLSVTQVIAHELAHQWFGNLVTAAWWSDIWLNEGFASYVQYIGTEGVNPNWKMDYLFIVDDLQSALAADDSSGSHPLYHEEGYFSTISYSKGACFLRMVNEFLGESTFTNALTNYLNDRAYDVATHDILFQFWIDEAKKDGLTFPYELQEVFETWVIQMGYPLLRVSRTNTNTVSISQEYFLIDPNDEPSYSRPGSDTYSYRWYVPFTYKESSKIADTNYIHEWMNLDDNLTLTTADDYILGNINAVGFYRVLYEGDMWEKIIQKMNSSNFNDISPQNRAQLLDDAFAISRSRKIPIESALSMTTYLHQELDYIPWKTFLDSIIYYDRMLARSVIYGDFSKYVLDLVIPSIYDHYGWEDSTDDNLLFERLTRGLAIEAACGYGYPECIDLSLRIYREWMENPMTNNISTTYRSDVYCTAIKAGGVEEWDFAWQQYLTIDSAQEKTSLRYAMSCSEDPWIINRYIEYAMDSTKVRNQDLSSTFSYIGGQEHGKYVAWSYAINNWDLLMSTVGASPTSSMLSAAVRRFSTDFDLALIDDLRPIAGSGWTGTLNSYTNSVKTNMDWRADNEAKIGAWLGSDLMTYDVATTRDKNKHVLPETDILFKHPTGFNKQF